MQNSKRKYFQYKFEQFIAKGWKSIFFSLLLVFVVLFILINIIKYILLKYSWTYDHLPSFAKHIWSTFLQMTDPWNMNQDNDSGWFLKIWTILSWLSWIIILSMLIAFITTYLENFIHSFRKWTGPVIEKDHTLILWRNERVLDIIRELIIANESEKSATIVILANEEKEKIDDLIKNRIKDTKTTTIITTSGNPSNTKDLDRVSVQYSKAVIILASATEESEKEEKIFSDNVWIKTIMAIIACQNNRNNIPIIVELFFEESRKIVGGFHDDQIVSIDSRGMMAKLLVQTSLTWWLDIVYNEILSFDWNEMYFYSADWENENFYNIIYKLKDWIPLWIHNPKGEIILRPEKNYKMQKDDEIIVLAEDDSTLEYKSANYKKIEAEAIPTKQSFDKTKKTLFIGWHNVWYIFINESMDYLKDWSTFDILINNPDKDLYTDIDTIDKKYPNVKIQVKDADIRNNETFKNIDLTDYDDILILSQNPKETRIEKIDTETLMILLIIKEKIKDLKKKPRLITQVLNPDNKDLITQTDIDDFIVSNKLITMILAQLSENILVKKFYDDIFQEDWSEIYLKPASFYLTDFDRSYSFLEIIEHANLRDEICLWVRTTKDSKNPDKNFWVVLNPNKEEEFNLEKDDYLVVLSEDEQ